jgi:uncharacterized protein YndB with AHSA1/START domain
MESIVTSIEIAAEPRKVYDAITTTEGNRGWWTTDCEVGRKPGEEAEFRFDDRRMIATFKIEKSDPSREVSMVCVRHENNEDWQDTRVTYTIAATPRGTRVELSHTEWRAKTKVYDMCVGGWSHFMNSLKSYVETGKGTPNGAK